MNSLFRTGILCFVLPLLISACGTYNELRDRAPAYESTVTARNGEELYAALPEGLTAADASGKRLRIMRPELRGNPRHAKWEMVLKGRAVIISVSDGKMRMRLLAGDANPGDRLICCETTGNDNAHSLTEKESPVKSKLNTGRLKGKIDPGPFSRRPVRSLRESVVSD
jgi:hypothetical protein